MWDAGVFYDELADGRCVGEAFRTWFNDILGRNSETTVHSWWYGMVINGDATLTPRAPAKPRYFLTVLTEGGGTCTPGSAYYDDGSSVSLRAEPAAGWHFRRWTGAVTGENPLATVHMDANKSVTAIFEADADAYDLVLRVEGSGTTSPAPGRHSLEAGRAVSVSAAAAAGWRFVRWSGDLAGTEPALSLRVDRSRTLTATFEPDIGENTLTMDVEGEGSTDPAVGAHTFTNGTTVTLRARPGLGWYFKTWHGDLDSSVNPVELTLSSSRHVTAVFTQSPMYQFTVATDGEGTVTPAPGAYAAGTKLSVTATPAAGWQFARWLGQLSTKVANATVTLDKDTSVIAVFVPVGVPKRVLAVTAASDGGVVSPPGGSFDPGTVVSIQAAPADGFRVRAWRGSDDDPSPGMTRNTVTMNEDREVMVEFEAVPETQYLLTAQVQGGHGTVRPEYQYCRAGNRVLIEANPDPGYRLAAWSGTDNDGSTELLNYATMDAARAVTVTFTMADAGSAGPSGAGDEGESLLPVTGCFIATAAYGSLLDPEVVDLCRFRDRWLMKNKLGRRLVKVYYRLSPPVAAEIARHPSMRLMVRIWLSPIVWVVSHPSGSVSVVMLFATLLLHRRIKRSARGPLALRVPIDPPRRR